MAKDAGTVRAPRGMKIVTRAFFAAADEIAEPYRPAVIKAALTAIREELKAVREKAALAKAKAKTPVKANSPAPAVVVAKAAVKPEASKTSAAAKLKAKSSKKSPAKPGRKAGNPELSQQPPALGQTPQQAEAEAEV